MEALRRGIVVGVESVNNIDIHSDSSETAFSRAIREFLGSLTERHKSDPENPFLQEIAAIDLSNQSASKAIDGTSYVQESIKSLTACIEALDKKRKKKHVHHLIFRMTPFLRRFERVAKVLEPLGQAGPMGIGVVFSGARIVLELAIGFHEYFEELVEALDEISAYVSVYETYGATFCDLPEFQDRLVRSYVRIIDFWCIASKRLLKTSLRMMDPSNSLGEEMKRIRAGLEKDSNLMHKFALVHESLRSQRDREKQQQDGIRQCILGGQAEQIDVRSDVNDRLQARHPGTCEWIFEDSRFVEWRDSKTKAVLWYNAEAGSGKSVLASAIIEHLRNREEKVAYFFFSFSDNQKKHGIHGFRSLIIQLMDLLSPNLTDHFMKLCLGQMKYAQTLASSDVAASLVHELVKRHEVFVVIDGLDECIDMDLPSDEQPGVQRHDMLEDLVNMVQLGSYTSDRWLFTSRKQHSRIRRAMEQINAVEIEADSAIIARDIRLYLKEKIRKYDLVDPPTDDSFLHATFLCSTFNSGQGLAGISKELNNFPRSLNGYFNRSLERIADHVEWKQEFARRLFLLLVTSHQSLTFDEVVDAMSVDQETTSYSRHNLLSNAKDLIEDLCGPLVKCDPVVKFSHKSVRDYFQQNPAGVENISKRIKMFFVHDSQAANIELGLDCLAYLSYDRYEQFQDVDHLLRSNSTEHSFLRYASTFWFQHLFAIKPNAKVRQRVERFLKSEAFWTCLSVQSRTAPFLFGFYPHRETDSFGMGIRGHIHTRHYKFGVPLPRWIDGPLKYLDQSFWCFVKEWREVLVTCPGGLKYCCPLRTFPESNSCHLAPLLDPKASDQLQLQVANLEGVPSLGRIVGMFAFDLRFRTGASVDLLFRSRNDPGNVLREVHVPIFRHKAKELKPRLHEVPVRESGDLFTYFVLYPTSQGGLETWYMNSQTLQLGRVLASQSEATSQPSTLLGRRSQHQPKTRWDLVETSIISSSSGLSVRMLRLNRVGCGLPDGSKKEDDSGSSDDSDDSSLSSAASSISDEEQPVSDIDETEDDVCVVPEEHINCLAFLYSEEPPIFVSWGGISYWDKVVPALHPKFPLVALTHSPTHLELIDVRTRDRQEKTVPLFPEIADTPTGAEAPAAHARELHFSTCGKYLHLVRILFLDLGHCTRCIVKLQTFLFTLGQADALRPLDMHSCTFIIQDSLGHMAPPLVLTSWADEHVIIALPPLTCDPKVLKIGLRNSASNDEQSNAVAEDTDSSNQIFTMQEQIHFPTSTPARSPCLKYRPKTEGLDSLYLTLGPVLPAPGEDEFGEEEVSGPVNLPCHLSPPIVLRWKFSHQSGWRAWDVEIDQRPSEEMEKQNVVGRLWGSFVDDQQPIVVPVRCGLDVNRKGVLTCR